MATRTVQLNLKNQYKEYIIFYFKIMLEMPAGRFDKKKIKYIYFKNIIIFSNNYAYIYIKY